MVAFAGHGIQPAGEFFFCPVGSELKDPKTLVSLNTVYEEMARSGAGAKLLLADACRNDPNSRAVLKLDEVARQQNDRRPQDIRPGGNVMAFFSCSPGEFAYEPDRLSHGLFFYYLISGLKGAADLDRDNKIVREELEYYVKREVNSYAISQLRKVQRPHLTGESNDQRPLVQFAASPPPAAASADVPRKAGALLDENFSTVRGSNLPDRWDGDGYRVLPDPMTKRPCLESSKTNGIHYVQGPLSRMLVGDFQLGIEFALSGRQYESLSGRDQSLHLRLEAPDGSVFPLALTDRGEVTLPDTAPRKADKFTRFGVNRLRLMRQGNAYNVQINDMMTAAAVLLYRGPFEDRLYLSVSAGKPGQDPGLKSEFTSKIYSVRAESLAKTEGSEAVVTSPARELMKQDFRSAAQGGALPEGWMGDGFSVLRDERFDRPCLEVRKESDVHFVTLPKLPLAGDFLIEVEFFLSGRLYRSLSGLDHEFHLRLEGPGVVPAHVIIEDHGLVRLPDAEAKEATRFQPFKVNRLRLLRQGTNLRAFLNHALAATTSLDHRGPFEILRIGLTAGRSENGTEETKGTAKVYAVRVLALPTGGMGDPPRKAPGIYEDFLLTKRGTLPAGWTSTPGGAVTTVATERKRPVIELTAENLGGGSVELPRVELEGDFMVSLEFEMLHKETMLTLQLEESPRRMLVLRVMGDGNVSLQGRPPVDASKQFNEAKKPELLRLERRDGNCTVTLNGAEIGRLPANMVAGKFQTPRIGIARKDKGQPSPRVYNVRIVPLEAAPAKP